MDFFMKRQTAALVLNIFQQKREISSIRFRPQKPGISKQKERPAGRLAEGIPEEEGVSSALLTDFLRQAQEHETWNPHAIVVLRNGKVLAKCAYAPYRMDVWHVTQSMCKGVVALAIGMLVDSGKLSLDEKIADIFPGWVTPLVNPLSFLRMKTITVRHLLTMTSGIQYNEAGSVTTEDWLKGFFESAVRFEPGTEFSYNSMNSYLLSAIVKEKTGMGLMRFLQPRLFLPLGIGKVHWETCPRGIEKGGWGLYLCPGDMAKIGQLLLQKGEWNGRRLISESYIREMTKKQVETPADMGNEGYGFQVWMGKRAGSFLLNGMMGQNILVMPDVNMVVVMTGGNDCLFKTSASVELAETVFGQSCFTPPQSLPADRRGLRELRAFEKTAYNRHGLFPVQKNSLLEGFKGGDLPRFCTGLHGKQCLFQACGGRLLPLFMQLVENNYSTGIDAVTFSVENKRFYMTVSEGKEKNKIEVDFHGEAVYSTVTVNGEPYLVAASGLFTKDEDGNPVLKILLPFIENSSGRKLKFFFYKNGSAELRISEMPDADSLLRDVGVYENKAAVTWVNRLVASHDDDIFAYTVRRATAPSMVGKLQREKPAL